jgi:hypothetical protein
VFHKNAALDLESPEARQCEETELVIAQRLLACILSRRLDDLQLSSDDEIEISKTSNEAKVVSEKKE